MEHDDVLRQRARKHLAGGVSAGGRFNHSLGGPLFLQAASGPWVESLEGRRYLDFHNAAGAAFFGCRHPRLERAVARAVEKGLFINFETEHHAALAELLTASVPCAEMVRLSNTGTEATMAAIRLARHYTGRNRIVRFEGHFHGMHELVWYNHSTLGEKRADGSIQPVRDSAGIPAAFDSMVLVTEFNDADSFQRLVGSHRDELAAVILEPVSFNCGCMPARPEFLRMVRETCTREKVVLIFDEVLSGFRMCLGGAQEHYGVVPDLCALAKAMGGGFPISALAGRKEIMAGLNPEGPVVMSGTYTGALMPVLASIECMGMMREPGFYDEIRRKAEVFYGGVSELFRKHSIRGHVRGLGARFGLFFGVEDPEMDYRFRTIAADFDSAMHQRFIRLALEAGLYFLDSGRALTPTHFGFTAAHSDQDLQAALEKLDGVFKGLSSEA